MEQIEVMLLAFWLIWTNKNSCFHKEICSTHALMRVQLLVNKVSTFHEPINRVSYPNSWSHSLDDYVKINVDAFFMATINVASLGMIVRDKNERVLLSVVAKERLEPSALHDEVKAILFGIKTAVQHAFALVIIESDSSLAIAEVLKFIDPFWDGSSLIMEILRLAAMCNKGYFVHVKRNVNMLAHRLARVDVCWVSKGFKLMSCLMAYVT
ncbi:hypothetical protein REPUB_Repub20aG0078400 [Reevesia pubescens]